MVSPFPLTSTSCPDNVGPDNSHRRVGAWDGALDGEVDGAEVVGV